MTAITEIPHLRGRPPTWGGAPLGWALADLRVPALVGLVVFVSAMWGRDGRGWHDLAAGTVVVADPEHPSEPDKPPQAYGPESGAEATAPRQGSDQSWGLVSDYYGTPPTRSTDRAVESPSSMSVPAR